MNGKQQVAGSPCGWFEFRYECREVEILRIRVFVGYWDWNVYHNLLQKCLIIIETPTYRDTRNSWHDDVTTRKRCGYFRLSWLFVWTVDSSVIWRNMTPMRRHCQLSYGHSVSTSMRNWVPTHECNNLRMEKDKLVKWNSLTFLFDTVLGKHTLFPLWFYLNSMVIWNTLCWIALVAACAYRYRTARSKEIRSVITASLLRRIHTDTSFRRNDYTSITFYVKLGTYNFHLDNKIYTMQSLNVGSLFVGKWLNLRNIINKCEVGYVIN